MNNKPRLLCGKSTVTRIKQTKDELKIEKLDEQKGKWVEEFSKKKTSDANYKIRSGYWKDAKQFVTVIYFSSGGRDFLTYSILGRKNGNITELCKNENIYYGDIYFEEGKLIEKRGGRYYEWKINGENTSLLPFKIPEIPKSLCIYYYLFPDGRVGINQTYYTVPVGTTIQVIRTDSNELPEGKYIIPMEGSLRNILDFSIKNREAFKVVKEGKVEVKIVPGFDFRLEFSIIIDVIEKNKSE